MHTSSQIISKSEDPHAISPSVLGAAARAGLALKRRVASGPFSTLYEGYKGETRVAVKLYAKQWLTSPERVERECFLQESISNRCVSAALLSQELDDGSFALVSEWIEGVSLEQRLQAQAGPMSWETIQPIMRDLARGLGAVHAAGMVHRDIKPSNIMLPSAPDTPSCVIIDFGHALLLDDARLTSSGFVLGTADYMAPEQAAGEELDHRADLYALGGVLYRMLTGALVFAGVSPADVMQLHMHEAVCPPSMRVSTPIQSEAEALCLWLLTKNRNQRVPNVRVLRLSLEAISYKPPMRPSPFPLHSQGLSL